jgi:hypothetical protein
MKRLLGLAVLALGLAVPAHAQFAGNSVGASGSIGSGGGLNGGGGFRHITSYPRAVFATTIVSGTETDFEPSAFVSYDVAVAEGRAVMAFKERSVVEVAREVRSTRGVRARVAFVQDVNGDPVIVLQ